jgi:hypothetical protein
MKIDRKSSLMTGDTELQKFLESIQGGILGRAAMIKKSRFPKFFRFHFRAPAKTDNIFV